MNFWVLERTMSGNNITFKNKSNTVTEAKKKNTTVTNHSFQSHHDTEIINSSGQILCLTTSLLISKEVCIKCHDEVVT